MVKYTLSNIENLVILDAFLCIQDHSFLIPVNKDLFDFLVFRLMSEDVVTLVTEELDLCFKVVSICLSYDWIDSSCVESARMFVTTCYLLLYV